MPITSRGDAGILPDEPLAVGSSQQPGPHGWAECACGCSARRIVCLKARNGVWGIQAVAIVGANVGPANPRHQGKPTMNVQAMHALYSSIVPPVPVSAHVEAILMRLQAERGSAGPDPRQDDITRLTNEIAARSTALAQLLKQCSTTVPPAGQPRLTTAMLRRSPGDRITSKAADGIC